MASRNFSTEEVVSLIMEDEEPEYDDPNEPIVEGSDEEYVCLEEESENGKYFFIIYTSLYLKICFNKMI